MKEGSTSKKACMSWYEPAAVDLAHLKWLAQTAEEPLEPGLPISATLPTPSPQPQPPHPTLTD